MTFSLGPQVRCCDVLQLLSANSTQTRVTRSSRSLVTFKPPGSKWIYSEALLAFLSPNVDQRVSSRRDSDDPWSVTCLLWRPKGRVIRDGGFNRAYAILRALPAG